MESRQDPSDDRTLPTQSQSSETQLLEEQSPSQPFPTSAQALSHADDDPLPPSLSPIDASHDGRVDNSHDNEDDDDDDENTTPFAEPTSLRPCSVESDLRTSVGGPVGPPLGAASTWSARSDLQLARGSVRNSSTLEPADRVFPIRSVVSVGQSQPTPWMHGTLGEHEHFPRSETWDGRHRPSNPRIETDALPDSVRRSEALPSSASTSSTALTDGERFIKGRRKGTRSSSVGSPTMDSRPQTSDSFQIASDSTSETSERIRDNASSSATTSALGKSPGRPAGDSDENLVIVRFRHVMTDEGHAVITGRDGTLQRCEDEPIHTPGAVQAYGVLVALSEEEDGQFLVRFASENSKRILGYSPKELFQLNSFMDIFSEEQADNLLDHIDFIRDEDADPSSNGPDVFGLSIRPPKGKSIKLWCAMHIPVSHPDLVLCEFEAEEDHQFPLRPSEPVAPSTPEDTLFQNPTIEEFNESTEASNKPLRVLRSARKKRGEAGAMQVFDIMSQVQEQLASAPNLNRFLKILVGIVKEMSGFHRVMIYQFDSAFNGKVVTELVDPTYTRDLYKGLHFPASDIPKQARDLYKLNKVRLLYDRDLPSARLVCRTVEDLERPLDLSHSYLRAMSPIHIKYLANMAVRASMSISITAFNELWGLIACHSYGSSGMRVAFPIRKLCRLIGDTASRNIERLSYASRLQSRKLINTMPSDKNPSGYIIASSEDLLKLFDADFGMLSIRGETKIMGKIEQSQEALAMLEYLRLRKFTSVVSTENIKEDFPDLQYPPGFSVVAGLLYVPLSTGGQDFIVLFRRSHIKDVKWAGNPHDKVIKEGTEDYLEPRASFQVWHERVSGKCREWSGEQIETAAVLCLVYGKFIEVWRQKEAALQNSRLTRLLLANSAHEVRTPLNAIINYLEIALESSLDQETRENLAKSHSASKSLIYVINDLLDLTQTEEGNELIKDEIFDLPECLQEATEAFRNDAKRKAIKYEVVEHPGLPRYVHGDERRVRQAIANLTANAVQHTSQGYVKVECYVAEVVDTKARIEIAIEDTGRGMTNDQLDALFQDLEQVSTDADDVTMEDDMQKSRGTRTLGLGLAVVARMVRNMDGQLRLKSGKGKGSRFVIQLPFELPSHDVTKKVSDGDSQSASVTTMLPPAEAGEVTLVERGSGNGTNNKSNRAVAKQKSFDKTAGVDEATSVSSLRSGISKGSGGSHKSDTDRLIDAIQGPLAIGEPDSEAAKAQRRASKNVMLQSNTNIANGATSFAESSSAVRPRNSGECSETRKQNTSTPPLQVSFTQPPPSSGVSYVKDTKTPIRPVKVPDTFMKSPNTFPQPSQSSGVLFEIASEPNRSRSRTDRTDTSAATSSRKLHVLIAEDDPINMKILRKRLEKAGHEVSHAVNGEDCATVYAERSQDFDVILMDMQMPIVDGLTSTKMIRSFEGSDKCPGLSSLASYMGRVPIFAVSASLIERERTTYVNVGFDGWILKPIDFKRLHTLLCGIFDDNVRNDCLYVSGKWERGGWFERRAGERSPRLGASGSSSEDITPTSNISE